MRRGFDVIDTSSVPVIAAAEQYAQTLAAAKPLSYGAIELTECAAAHDGRIAPDAVEINRRPLLRGLCNQIYRSPDRVTILVCGKRLVNFHRFNKVCWNDVQLDLANAGFGRGNIHSIDRYIAEPRFETANLHIFALTLIALQRDAGQTAQSISNIGIRQAGYDFGGKYLKDVLGCPLAVDGFRFAMLASRIHRNLFLRSRYGKF